MHCVRTLMLYLQLRLQKPLAFIHFYRGDSDGAKVHRLTHDWKVTFAFYSSFLLQLRRHDNDLNFILQDHAPKLYHCCWKWPGNAIAKVNRWCHFRYNNCKLLSILLLSFNVIPNSKLISYCMFVINNHNYNDTMTVLERSLLFTIVFWNLKCIKGNIPHRRNVGLGVAAISPAYVVSIDVCGGGYARQGLQRNTCARIW